MNTNPLKQGMLTENSRGLGTVTRKMVRERAVQLAIMDGRSAHEPSKSDWELAKSELTGRPEATSNDLALDAAPVSERWDPLPGSTGQKIPVPAGEDEDDEGRSDQELLVEEGAAEAVLDHVREAGQGRLP